MSLIVAGRNIPQASAISELGRLCLSLVDGGLQWLDWAIHSNTVRYNMPDETQLVANAQQGLHGTPLTLLPVTGLSASPVKLMTLGLADLRVLAEAETQGTSDGVVDARLNRILAQHQLVRQQDLHAVQAWLTQLGVSNAPHFGSMSLPEALCLYQLLQQPATENTDENPQLSQAAAQFGIDQARSPMEFADYYQFYLALAAEQKQAEAINILQALLPNLFQWLDCPQLQGLPSPIAVIQAVKDWNSRSRQLGFARISLAALRIVQHTGFSNAPTDNASASIWRYVQAAQSFLLSTTQVLPHMNQDGASCQFILNGGAQQATLLLDGNSIVSLDDYTPNVNSSQSNTPAETSPSSPQAA
ncbi:hypothetical protein [Uliginosibacterium gangwonense]|uniref:hypothetical protein n=1 Tax=Uliginosibacterium gangwonense TaxID=392736 RepID=UPI00037EFA5F|nr:hypothetical protein [Uliginosibacterium gangwonense]